jgi:hypothetical protein
MLTGTISPAALPFFTSMTERANSHTANACSSVDLPELLAPARKVTPSGLSMNSVDSLKRSKFWMVTLEMGVNDSLAEDSASFGKAARCAGLRAWRRRSQGCTLWCGNCHGLARPCGSVREEVSQEPNWGRSSASSERKALSTPLCGVAVSRIRCRSAIAAIALTSSWR